MNHIMILLRKSLCCHVDFLEGSIKCMKKILYVFLIICTLFFCISCNLQPAPSEEESCVESNSENEVPSSVEQKLSEYIISDGRPSNGIIEDYYIQEPVELNLQEEISSYASTSTASAMFSALYKQSNNISTIPILGTYLEYTALQVCLFYSNDTLIGTRAIVLSENDEGIFVKDELETILGSSYIETPFSDKHCFAVLSACMQNYPDFNIQGAVYNQNGYMEVYPIGLQSDDPHVKYYDYNLCNFLMVEPFSTISEGQNRYSEHWNRRDELISMLPVYEWKDSAWWNNGYISKYKYQDVYRLHKESESQYLFDFDWLIAIPLLDADGNEGIYVLHLLYYRDVLIAELLLENTSEMLIPKKEIISEKGTAAQEYIGLSQIDYLNCVTKLLETLDNNSVVKGIGFDGENYTVILASE